MRFASIASGSEGNCTYIGTERAHILIDAGISCKRIEEGLHKLEISMKDLDAIFVTHEHGDHIKGLPMLTRKYEIPIYATEGTLNGILAADKKSCISKDLCYAISADEQYAVKDLQLQPFRNYHDAAEPVAYRINQGDKSVAVVTDLGTYDDYTVSHLNDLDAILLEANHDIRMLECGPYPYRLKRRILGNFGHLSNENSGRLLNELLHDRFKYVLLGHLSKQNNYEALAFETVCDEINCSESPYHAMDFDISIAKPNEVSKIMEF